MAPFDEKKVKRLTHLGKTIWLSKSLPTNKYKEPISA
jgi:hypothetical protein